MDALLIKIPEVAARLGVSRANLARSTHTLVQAAVPPSIWECVSAAIGAPDGEKSGSEPRRASTRLPRCGNNRVTPRSAVGAG